jgi:uncharacterized protein YndB with AHSA1/START domain
MERANMTTSKASPKTTEDEFAIARRFDAPRDEVFKAFTEPERMQHWWGPKGMPVVAAKMDLRPGGIYHYGLRAADGSTMWGKFVYREVVRPSRIVLVNSFSDEAGSITRHPMSPTWLREMLSTFLFEEENGGTRVTIIWSPLDPDETERATFAGAKEAMQQGWTGTLDQLADYLRLAG